MKRALLAILILGAGATVFCALRASVATCDSEIATQVAAWQMQTQRFTELSSEKQKVLAHLASTKQWLAVQQPVPPLTRLAERVLAGDALKNLSAAESEQLLAELGFNWNTTGEFLIISKSSLDGISFEGMKGVKLTDAAIGTLAITPAEQTLIETVTRQVGEARTAWAKEHLQRIEPSGNVVAQYSLAVDPEFGRNQLVVFTNAIFAALGPDRGRWLQDHSLGWMTDLGLRTGLEISEAAMKLFGSNTTTESETPPTTLTLERYRSGDEWFMNYTLKQAGNTMTTSVNPQQPVPEAFRVVFPGGWQEIAQREGFELPKAFNQN